MSKPTWQEAVLLLKDRNVEKIIVKYSGSGDSGSIDEIVYNTKNDKDKDFYAFSIGLTDEQHDGIENLVYPMLDDIEDWYNNDGGHGTVEINLSDLSYKIENNITITDYETYNHEGSIKDLMTE